MDSSDAEWIGPLLAWYQANSRPLPWRTTPTPYRVWVSEIMLQQTQVATVTPYFLRFVARFPDIDTLAEATQEDVLRLWEGLGYYSRARNLHRAAGIVVTHHQGILPDSHTSLLSLPGIGPYTAAAIASIAFGQPVPVVDGNVARVFCRLWEIEEDTRTPELRPTLSRRLEPFIGSHSPADFNQALMELGALVCAAATPKCGQCPVAASCGALATVG